ncbi:unnamed protein product [Arctogadus glacialis]
MRNVSGLLLCELGEETSEEENETERKQRSLHALQTQTADREWPLGLRICRDDGHLRATSSAERKNRTSNKDDLTDTPQEREKRIDERPKRLQKTVEHSLEAQTHPTQTKPQGVPELMELLKTQSYRPDRDPHGPLLMAVDHCFFHPGPGTVMTGTILQGALAVNDTVEIPTLKVTKKVKSMQMFRTPVSRAMQGDRVGVCVTQFDPKLRGARRGLHAGIGYFKGALATRAKFHVTVGPDTPRPRHRRRPQAPLDRALQLRQGVPVPERATRMGRAVGAPDPEQWALLEFERPVTCPALCLVIGSKLDTDIHANACRLAFQGRLLEGFQDKMKHKEGQVERVTDDYTVIGRSLFKKETNMQLFVGLKVALSTGEAGVIEGGFGQSGKYKIRVAEGLRADTILLLGSGSKKKGKGGGKTEPGQEEEPRAESHPVSIHLHFKRYVFDTHKKMVQS